MKTPDYAGLPALLAAALLAVLMLTACSDDRGLDSGTGSSTRASVPTNTAAPGPRSDAAPSSTQSSESPESDEPSFVPAPSTPLPPQDKPSGPGQKG